MVGGTDWVDMVEDRGKWQAVVKAVINCEKFLD